MTQKQITEAKIADLRKQWERASTWSEKGLIENMIAFLQRDLDYLWGGS